MSWVIGQGSRNGRAGWVAYRDGRAMVGDVVFENRDDAEAYADARERDDDARASEIAERQIT